MEDHYNHIWFVDAKCEPFSLWTCITWLNLDFRGEYITVNFPLDFIFIQETNFTKCNMCTVAAEQRSKTLDGEKRQKIKDVLNKHLDIARCEIKVFHLNERYL